MPTQDTPRPDQGATHHDLGPAYNAAREQLRATTLALVDAGEDGRDPLKCMATAATALLGQANIECARLAAKVEALERSRYYACEKPCGDCCGCQAAHDDLSEADS